MTFSKIHDSLCMLIKGMIQKKVKYLQEEIFNYSAYKLTIIAGTLSTPEVFRLCLTSRGAST